MPLEQGSLLGPYEIHSPLGAGGMGEVYQARDRRLGRRVALKVLPERLTGDAESRARLLAEARSASALDHPGIVTIFDVGSEGGVDYVAMELVDGEPLSAIIARGALPIREVLRLGRDIGEALAAAHVRGVIHRDLKPANILVRRDGRPKILDFGLAKRLDPIDAQVTLSEADKPLPADDATVFADVTATAPGALLGTPAYMAPEQARGERVDHRSDLFSLGGVLYEMTTGQRPFGGRNAFEVLSAILLETPPPLERLRPDAPPELRRILEKALAKAPDQRYQDAGRLVADLEALAVAESGANLPPPPPATRPSRGTLAAGLAAVALGIALFMAYGRGPAATPDPGLKPEGFRLLAEGSGYQPAFSPDGRTLAFIGPDAEGIAQLWIRPLAGGQPVPLTRGPRAASYPAFFPSGKEIVFGLEGLGIWAVATRGGATPRRLLEAGMRPGLSPDGRRLVYVLRNRIHTADLESGQSNELRGVPETYFGDAASAAFSPDGRSIAIFQPEEFHPLGFVAVLPAEGGEARRLTPGRFEGGDVTWSHDGRFVIYSSNVGGSQNLWTVPVEGGEPQPLTTGAGEDREPQISPDGRQLVYSNTRTRHVLIRFDPRTGQRREVLDRRSQIIMPELSPDRRTLVFFSRRVDGLNIFTVSVEGGEPTQITRSSRDINNAPRWSGDGREIYYYSLPEAPARPSVRRIPAAGGESLLVNEGWTWVHQNAICLAPDGRRLAYSYRQTRAVVEARVRDLESGAERPLDQPLGWCQWSSDGRAILGTSPAGVFLCPADGAACRRLTASGRPRFSADGNSVLVGRGQGGLMEIWTLPLAGGEESLLARIQGWNYLSSTFNVLANGELIWNSVAGTPPELWVADLDPDLARE